jgi:hypothetical protein
MSINWYIYLIIIIILIITMTTLVGAWDLVVIIMVMVKVPMLSGFLISMAWHILRLQMKAMASSYGRQLWTTNKAWSSNFGVELELRTSHQKKYAC